MIVSVAAFAGIAGWYSNEIFARKANISDVAEIVSADDLQLEEHVEGLWEARMEATSPILDLLTSVEELNALYGPRDAVLAILEQNTLDTAVLPHAIALASLNSPHDDLRARAAALYRNIWNLVARSRLVLIRSAEIEDNAELRLTKALIVAEVVGIPKNEAQKIIDGDGIEAFLHSASDMIQD